MLALFPLKLDPQGLFERRTNVGQGGQFAAGSAGPGLDAGLGVAGVRREEPRHVLRGRDRRRMEHHPQEVFDEPLAVLLGELVRGLGRFPESLLTRSQPILLEPCGLSIGIPAHQHEIAVVGDKNLTVLLEIPDDLLARGDRADIIAGPLDLDRAPRRQLTGQRIGVTGALELVGREQAAVGQTRPPVREVDHAPNFRLERSADLIQEVRQRRVERSLLDVRAR